MEEKARIMNIEVARFQNLPSSMGTKDIWSLGPIMVGAVPWDLEAIWMGVLQDGWFYKFIFNYHFQFLNLNLSVPAR